MFNAIFLLVLAVTCTKIGVGERMFVHLTHARTHVLLYACGYPLEFVFVRFIIYMHNTQKSVTDFCFVRIFSQNDAHSIHRL
jgi:hypothetical protein